MRRGCEGRAAAEGTIATISDSVTVFMKALDHSFGGNENLVKKRQIS